MVAPLRRRGFASDKESFAGVSMCSRATRDQPEEISRCRRRQPAREEVEGAEWLFLVVWKKIIQQNMDSGVSENCLECRRPIRRKPRGSIGDDLIEEKRCPSFTPHLRLGTEFFRQKSWPPFQVGQVKRLGCEDWK